MNREVAALEAVIESREEREIGAVRGERLEERRQREVATGLSGKKCGLVEAQHVADSDHALRASRADGGTGFARDAETGAEHAGREGFEERECERDTGGTQEKAAINNLG